MNSIVRYKLIQYCINNGNTKEVATQKVDYAQDNCPYSYWHKVTDYLDELMLCSCGEINHESNMFDTEGTINGSIGIVCLDCVKNGGY